VPSFFAPTFTVMSALGAFPVQSWSCFRSSISLTGAPAFFASRHATIANALPVADGPSLLPKPPPMWSQSTRTFLRSIPSASARPSRTAKMPCVEAWTVS
jgi:hypothetical protein